jgi:hypothetical protein
VPAGVALKGFAYCSQLQCARGMASIALLIEFFGLKRLECLVTFATGNNYSMGTMCCLILE